MDEPIEVDFKYRRTNLFIPIYLSLPTVATIIAYRSPEVALRCSLSKRLRKGVCEWRKTILFTRMHQAGLLDLNHKPVLKMGT